MCGCDCVGGCGCECVGERVYGWDSLDCCHKVCGGGEGRERGRGSVGVGVIVWVGVGVIAWVRKGVCGLDSLDCYCKVCVCVGGGGG